MFVKYARKEPTKNPIVLKQLDHPEKRKDTVLYDDKSAKCKYCTFEYGTSFVVRRNAKSVYANCFKWPLIWLKEI